MQIVKLYVKISDSTWSIILKLDDKEFQLSKSISGTSNAVAIQAVIEGLRRIATPEKTKIIICSDIEYLINSGRTYKAKWERNNWKKADGLPPKNLELWKNLTAWEKRFLRVEWKLCRTPDEYPDDYETSDDSLDNDMLNKVSGITRYGPENEERHPEFIYLEEDEDSFMS